MLEKYLQTQQDNFDIMRSRHGQLQQKADFEQQRAQLLAQHIDAMDLRPPKWFHHQSAKQWNRRSMKDC